MPDRRKIDPEVFLTQINAILFQIWQKPFGSVSDLQRSPDLNGLSRTTLTDRLDWLETRDYIGSETVGWVRKRRRRFFLHSKGIYRVMGQRGIPLDWAVTESALWILRHQLPALEALYTVAPDLWSAGGVASAEPGVWQLDRLKLLGKGTTLALAEYGRRDRTSQVGERRVVAYVWYGVRSPKGSVAKDLHSLMTRLPEPKPAVCGVVILATDRFAGMCARMDLDPELRRAIVTVDGEVVQSLGDAIPSGPITSIRERGMEMGSPENLTARVVEDPSLSALKGQTDYTILRVHEEWNGSDEKSVVSLCGHGRSAARKTTTLLEDAGLLERDGKTVYPADGLRTLSEKRDRLDQRRIRGRAEPSVTLVAPGAGA